MKKKKLKIDRNDKSGLLIVKIIGLYVSLVVIVGASSCVFHSTFPAKMAFLMCIPFGLFACIIGMMRSVMCDKNQNQD